MTRSGGRNNSKSSLVILRSADEVPFLWAIILSTSSFASTSAGSLVRRSNADASSMNPNERAFITSFEWSPDKSAYQGHGGYKQGLSTHYQPSGLSGPPPRPSSTSH